MKAIDWIKNKVKKPSRSTVLFWSGWFLGPLALVLRWIFPSAQLVFDVFTVVGFALAGSQKLVGDREQRQQVDQEHKAREEAEQRLRELTTPGHYLGALEEQRQRASMTKDSHQ